MGNENLTVRVILTGRRGARYVFDMQGNGASLERLTEFARREAAAVMRESGSEYDTFTVSPL